MALAWFAGTLCVHQLPRLPPVGAFVPLALGALVALRFGATRCIAVAIVAFVWTSLWAQSRLDERLTSLDAGRDVALRGYVDGFPAALPGQTTFSFFVTEAPAGIPPRLRLTWYEPARALSAGDALSIVARLRPPHGTRNPGGFDYERWLLVTAHGATGYVRSGGLDAAASHSPASRWLGLRAHIAERIGASLTDSNAAALVTALALGERYRFTEQHWADFRRTGTSHLVAVSGMHVALLGVLVFVALRSLWLRLPQPLAAYDLEAASIASAIATVYYSALTGFALPAQRSVLMIATALALTVARRSVGAVQVLAAALLVVLVWDPFAPLAASFWLSFAAVGALLALAAPRFYGPRAHLAPFLRAAAELVRMQWPISLALLPLTAAFFGEVSIVGPVVNLVAIPLFNLVLVPLTLVVTLLLHADASAATLAPPLLEALGWLASQTVAALHAVAEHPLAAVAVPPASAIALAAGVCGVALALPIHPLPGRRLCWLAVLPVFCPSNDAPETGSAEVVVLDVGQGLSVSVATHQHRLLFDAGPRFGSGFDSGADIVLPALAAGAPRRLDRLVVSHADNDHSGGAGAVVAAFPGVDVLKGPDVTALGGATCARGEHWIWDGVDFAILHPALGAGPSGNESSCVLKVSTGGGSVLIAGDIEARAEAELVRHGGLESDVVVVPHHGSSTSSSSAFVAAVSPRHAIVSAGYANRWGFPKADVRERWERAGAALDVTADRGALTVSLTSSGVALRAERERRNHYWQFAAEAR
jgi:competence protein ComEC